MTARTFFLLLALSTTAEAQQFTNLLWPPRDIGSRELFGLYPPAVDGNLLAVPDFRDSENGFVRVYRREGLNWIEDARLSVQPRTPVDGFHIFGRAVDVDGERILAGSTDAVHVFRRFGERDWGHKEILPPVPMTGTDFGRELALGGDWMAVSTSAAVYLLHHEQDEWLVSQEIAGNGFRLELDGSNLLLVGPNHNRIFRFDGTTWNQELDLAFSANFTPADLEGDRLGVLTTQMSRPLFRLYERSGSSWLLTGSGFTSGTDVALSGQRAYVFDPDYPHAVEVLDQLGSAWVSASRIESPYPTMRSFGYSVLASGPLLVIAANAQMVEHEQGTLSTYALDGQRSTLRASHVQMALEQGGTLILSLDAGIENAGKAFFLGGSLAGTSPGARIGGVRVPLNAAGDPYFPFSRRRGHLDGAGRTVVEVELPPIQPGATLAFLKDRTLHHVFVIWERGRGITHVSNVELTALVGRFH